jgi:hypothetical protein
MKVIFVFRFVSPIVECIILYTFKEATSNVPLPGIAS